MRWNRARRSENVVSASGRAGRGLGLGGLVVVLIVGLLFGREPAMQLLGQMAGGGGGVPQQVGPAPDDPQVDFVRAVLGSTEDVWDRQFQGRYQPPKLVLFSGAVQSACGSASSATGPFYCPGDSQVYLDLDFFREMQQRFRAEGDFARAYVIAHEVGHHIQNLTGTMRQVREQARRGTPMQGDGGLSVRQELQADCYAGVWANHAQRQLDWLEPGDIEAALNAARAIGDDALQKQARGVVVPDSFTHGTSAERMRWFGVGFETGDVARCDTFAAGRL